MLTKCFSTENISGVTFSQGAHFCLYDGEPDLYLCDLCLSDGEPDLGGRGRPRALGAGGDHQVGGLLGRGLRHRGGGSARQPHQPRGPHQA